MLVAPAAPNRAGSIKVLDDSLPKARAKILAIKPCTHRNIKDRGRGGGNNGFLGVEGSSGGGAGLVDFQIFFRVILLRRRQEPCAWCSPYVPP